MATGRRETEHEVKQDLSAWITDNTDAEIYWEQQNESEYETFTVRGVSGQKPDLLIRQSHCVYAVETKSGADSAEVYDSFPQLHRYIQQYANDDAHYIIDGETTTIDAFLVANQHSRQGRLFKKKREKLRQTEKKSGRWWAWKKGKIPLTEWNRTEAAIRIMMRYANELLEEYHVGVGALLSSSLDSGDQQKPLATTPKVLVYHQDRDWSWKNLGGRGA